MPSTAMVVISMIAVLAAGCDRSAESSGAEKTKSAAKTSGTAKNEPKAGEAKAAGEAKTADDTKTKATLTLTPIALAGPFESIKALCKDAKTKAVNPSEPCEKEGHPAGMGPTIERPPSILAFEFREVGDPGRGAIDDISCVVALETPKGWFHHTWHCEGFIDSKEVLLRLDETHPKDLIRTGDPELVAHMHRSMEAPERTESVLMICDASEPEGPWCTAPILVGATEGSPDDAKSWALKVAPTPDGFTLERDSGTLPPAQKKRLGTYALVLPPSPPPPPTDR